MSETFTTGAELIGAAPSPDPTPTPPPTPDAKPKNGGIAGLDLNTLTFLLATEAPTETFAPAWARVPTDLKIPPGREVMFVRFPSGWTDQRNVGHEMPDMPGLWRQVIMWSMSAGDETIAINRAMGDTNRLDSELVKQTIRAIDGLVIDQTGIPTVANIDRFWGEIGAKCRDRLKRIYTGMAVLTREQAQLFLVCCVVRRVAG